MADRYWVGGTANWDGTAGTKWATTSGGAGGASVPTSADAVFFTNLSTGTCTISAGNTGALSIDCTGFTGTVTGGSAISVAGSITLVSGMTFTAASTVTITGTGTITTAGKQISNLIISVPGGTVTLGDALQISNTGTFGLRIDAGTFNTSASNYSITASQLSSSNSNVRSIVLNGSSVSLANTTPIVFTTSTNLTFNAGTSTITCTNTVPTFNGGGRTFNNVTFSSTSATSVSITGANTFNTLTFTAPSASGILPCVFSDNQTSTTLVAAGASIVRRIFLASSVVGTRRTLTVTTWTTISDVDFRDIGMNSSRSGTRLGNCGNNNNITFDAAKTVYWNLTGTQNWSSTGWATTSGGSPAVNNFPLAQDTVVFDNAGAATTVSINANWQVGNLNMSARTNAMTLGGTGVSVYGNWTCGTGVTQSFANSVSFLGAGTQTITSAGKSFYRISCQNPSGTVSLADAFTTTDTSGGITAIFATFNANTYSVTTAEVTASSATLGLGTGTWTVFGTGALWNCSTATITGSGEIILSDNTTTDRTFIAGTSTYGKLTIGGNTSTSTTTISAVALSFSEIASTKTVAHTIVFPNVTTTTAVWSVNGSSGNVVTLSRTGASGTFTLAKSGGGTVTADWLSISNSTATPGSTWTATNSIDGGGNTGWTITAPPPPPPSSGNFIAFFM